MSPLRDINNNNAFVGRVSFDRSCTVGTCLGQPVMSIFPKLVNPIGAVVSEFAYGLGNPGSRFRFETLKGHCCRLSYA